MEEEYKGYTFKTENNRIWVRYKLSPVFMFQEEGETKDDVIEKFIKWGGNFYRPEEESYQAYLKQ